MTTDRTVRSGSPARLPSIAAHFLGMLLGSMAMAGLAGCTEILGIEDLPPLEDAARPDGRPGTPDARPGELPDAAGRDAGDVTPPDAAPDASPTPACTDQCSDGCGSGCCAERCADNGDCVIGCDLQDCDCALDCGGTDGTCHVECNDGARCEMDCSDVNECVASCRDEAACTIDCTGTNNCDRVRCEDAECLLRCAGSANCEFALGDCDAGGASCPGDVLVCNRACP